MYAKIISKIKNHILMDLSNNTRFVQLKLSEFQKLLDYIEDMEDALELKRAKKAAKGFTSLEDIKKELLSASDTGRK